MANIIDLVTAPKARTLEEFSDAFRDAYALGPVEEWAAQMGLYVTSQGIKSTYPIPVSAAGYRKLKGDKKYRSLFARSLTMKGEQWQDGVKELASIVEAPDFTGWAHEPAAMALEAVRLPNTLVAEALEANANIDLYRDDEKNVASTRAFFAGDHPFNIFKASTGTFDNDVASGTHTAINKALFVAMKDHFRSLKGANGKSLGMRMTHFFCAAAREEEAKEFLEQDMLIEAVTNVAGNENVAAVAQNNRHKNTVTLVVVDEFTNDGLVYGASLGKPGMFPWIVQTTPLDERILDKNSATYELTNEIGVSYELDAAAKLAMPHAMIRVDLA